MARRFIGRVGHARGPLAAVAGFAAVVTVFAAMLGGTAHAATRGFDPVLVSRVAASSLSPRTGGPSAVTIPRAAPAVSGLGLRSCSSQAYRGDPRLGPRRLPVPGLSEVGDELLGYHRGGSLTTARLLARYWNPSASNGAGGWIYPPHDGYTLDHAARPIEHVVTLRPGTRLDRYGSEYGGFLSPLGTSYARRAIPPSNLDTADPAFTCDYHAYVVVKAFRVDSGVVAPWFGQPGGGVQDQLNTVLLPAARNVGQLVASGYLRRLDLHEACRDVMSGSGSCVQRRA